MKKIEFAYISVELPDETGKVVVLKNKRKKAPNQMSKESKERKREKVLDGRKQKRKKESSRSKDRKKTKEKRNILDQRSEENKGNIQKGFRTKKYVNKPTELSQANKKRKEATQLEVLLSL